MPMREWGLGLELLAECYLKYKEWCIVERGRVYAIPDAYRLKGKSFPTGVKWQPFEADLLAVKRGLEELILVQCTEKVTLPKAKQMLGKMQHMGGYLHSLFGQADPNVKISYMLCYTVATNDSKEYLQSEYVTLLSFDELVEGIQSIMKELAGV